MPDNKTPDQRSAKSMSVDDIIADVMKKKKSLAADSVSGDDKKPDILKDDSYLSDYEIKSDGFGSSDLKSNSETAPQTPPATENTVADGELGALIAAAMTKKAQKETVDEDSSLDKKLDTPPTALKKAYASPASNDLADDSIADEPQKKRLSKKRITSVALCYFFGIIFILLGVGVSVFGYYTGLLNRPSGSGGGGSGGISVNPVSDKDTMDEAELRKQLAAAQESFMSNDNVTNILIIGEDIRDTADGTNGNTDVMMLVSINDKTKEVTLASFMRDMYVEIADSGGTYAKLNSAYAAGGADLTMKTLKNNFGIDVDKYVLFNFYTFIDIVDACGGIDIRISDEEAIGMQAPMAEQNDCLGNPQGTDFFTEGGTYHMNGNQALAYSRLRYVGNADFERTARQRRVVSKIAEGAKELSLMELSDLLDKVLTKLETNLTDGEIAYLLYNSTKLLNYDLGQLRIPADGMFTNETIRGEAVLVVDFLSSIKLFQETVYGYSNITESSVGNIGGDGYNDYGYDGNDYYDSYSDDYSSDYSDGMNFFQ